MGFGSDQIKLIEWVLAGDLDQIRDWFFSVDLNQIALVRIFEVTTDLTVWAIPSASYPHNL